MAYRASISASANDNVSRIHAKNFHNLSDNFLGNEQESLNHEKNAHDQDLGRPSLSIAQRSRLQADRTARCERDHRYSLGYASARAEQSARTLPNELNA